MPIRKQILVVDDERGIREMISAAFQVFDYPVTAAANGMEALEMLKAMPNLPALILVDLMMPEMGGKEFAEKLKSREEWADIPIVLMTAFPNQTGVIERAKMVLEKPVDLDVLLAVAERFCA
jgi:CheY-like chemotaxis protein